MLSSQLWTRRPEWAGSSWWVISESMVSVGEERVRAMQLSDREIHGLLQDGHLIIVGPKTAHRFDAACQVRPASIDLRVDARITTLYFSGQ